MAEKKEDQTQEKIEPQEKAPEQAQKEEKSEERILPKKDFFKGNDMAKHLEKIEAEEALSKPKEEAKKEVEKPAPEKKETKEEEKREPILVLERKGEKIPVYSKEELKTYAQQGLDYTKKRQEDAGDRKDWEKGRDKKESQLLELGEGVSKLIEGIERGDLKVVPTGTEESEQDGLEEFDPEIRDQFKKLHDENKSLKEELGTLTEKSKVGDAKEQQQAFYQVRDELDTLHEEVRGEIPYDVIKVGEREISKDLFTGLVTQKFNADRLRAKQDKDFEPRNFKQIFIEVAKDLKAVENHYKGGSSGIVEGETVTSEVLKQKYPDLVAELGEAAVEAHLSGQENAPASIKSTLREAKETKKPGKVTSLADAINQGFEDPEIVDGLAKFSKTDYGLKNE